MSDLERELAETLHRVIDPIAARPIPARRQLHHRGAFRTVVGGAGAALTVKVLAGVAAVAAAATVAGVVTTGTLNPTVWGQQMKQTVISCRDNVAHSGQQGIGECVSDIANTHGATVASDARHHGDTNPNGNSGGGGGSSNGKDKDKGRHTPPVPPAAGARPSPGH